MNKMTFNEIKEALVLLGEELKSEQTYSYDKYRTFNSLATNYLEGIFFDMLTSSNDRFYGNMLINSSRVNCYCIGVPVSTQVTNNFIKLLINPLLLLKYSIEEIKTLLRHEVIHLIALHHTVIDQLETVMPRKIAVMAADISVNRMLIKEGCVMPSNMLTDETLYEVYGVELSKDSDITTADLAYELNSKLDLEEFNFDVSSEMYKQLEMIQAMLEELGFSSGEIGMDMAIFEECEDLMLSMTDSHSDALLISDFIKHITIEASTNSRGLLPGGLSGLIKVLLAPPVIKWQDELSRFIATIKANHKATPFRRSRRFPERLDIKGQLPDKEIDLVIAIDTSGSMSDEIIGECINELFDITSFMKRKFTIIECDSDIQRVYEVEKPNDINPEVVGRGGTSFTPVFRWLEENKKSDAVLVYMTDGFGESCIDSNIVNQGTVWFVTGEKEDLSTRVPRDMVLSYTNK